MSSSSSSSTSSSPRRGESAADDDSSLAPLSQIDHEYWNELQYQVSLENITFVEKLSAKHSISHGAGFASENIAVPRITPLHIACRTGNLAMVKLLQPYFDVNASDQYGLTPLHYATVKRSKELVLFLLASGAMASKESLNGSTAKDLAEQLNFEEIIDALQSKMNLEKDPTLPQFRSWLNALGAGEFLSNFVNAGYDIAFIAKHGLDEKDLDCVGIPSTKMGLRRKIMSLHELTKYYEEEEEEEEEEDEDEEDEDEEEEDEEEAEEEDE